MPRISISDSSTFFRLLSLAENSSKKVSEFLKRLLCGYRNRKFLQQEAALNSNLSTGSVFGNWTKRERGSKNKICWLTDVCTGCDHAIPYSTTWPQATKACLKRTKVVKISVQLILYNLIKRLSSFHVSKCSQQDDKETVLPEKSIRGNIASSGMFVSAVQTFSSNNFNTAKKQRNILSYAVFLHKTGCRAHKSTVTHLFL